MAALTRYRCAATLRGHTYGARRRRPVEHRVDRSSTLRGAQVWCVAALPNGRIVSASGHALFEYDDEEDPNPYQVEHDELFAAIAAGRFAYADGENGAIATMTSILGRMATYSGRMIEWDEALASEMSLMPERYAWDAPPPVLPDEHGRYSIPVPGVTQVL